jgi:hypothetical protein
MRKNQNTKRDPDMLPEYDFSRGVRGKHAKRYAAGSNIIVLAPDLVTFFPNSQAVNEALRALVQIARKAKNPKPA